MPDMVMAPITLTAQVMLLRYLRRVRRSMTRTEIRFRIRPAMRRNRNTHRNLSMLRSNSNMLRSNNSMLRSNSTLRSSNSSMLRSNSNTLSSNNSTHLSNITVSRKRTKPPFDKVSFCLVSLLRCGDEADQQGVALRRGFERGSAGGSQGV